MTSGALDILIVEDEPKLARLMIDFLSSAGYAPRWVADGLAVEAALADHMPQLVILDLMLPGRHGRDICRDLRAVSDVPIIMVTAQIEEVDRLLGLEIGADDYICKPFSLLELVARVKAILRRVHPDDSESATTLSLREERFEVIYQGVSIELTPVEFRLLKTLADRPGRVFSRGALMHHLYTDHRVVEDRTIDSHVKKVRRKLQSVAPGEDIIQSVYGAGYKLVC